MYRTLSLQALSEATEPSGGGKENNSSSETTAPYVESVSNSRATMFNRTLPLNGRLSASESSRKAWNLRPKWDLRCSGRVKALARTRSNRG